MDQFGSIDDAIATWAREVPDLDVATMRTVLLLARVASLSRVHVGESFAEHGISAGEFDVLASLLGSPEHISTPSELAKRGMLSPAGMTHRLDLLERAGLIERRPDPHDRRSTLIHLTAAGRTKATEAAHAHVASEAEVLSPLTDAERRRLDALLSKLADRLGALTSPAHTSPALAPNPT